MSMNTNKPMTFSLTVWKRILQFYCNATLKYHIYTLIDAIKDAQLAYQDRRLLDTNTTLPQWATQGYKVCRNKRGWYFAYIETEGDLRFYSSENYRNMSDNATVQPIPSVPSMIKQASDASQSYLNYERPFQPVFGGYAPPKVISTYRGFTIVQDSDTEMFRIVRKDGIPLLKYSFHSITWNKNRQRKDILAYGMIDNRKVVIYTNGFSESRISQIVIETINSYLRKNLLLAS